MDPPETARPFLGIALKVASTIVFTAMATLIKLASDRYPIGELTFFRSFFALIPVFIWVGFRGQFPSVLYTAHIGQHFIRSVAGATAMFCGFTALAMLPIADATAIGYASPLLTVVFAVFLLGEQVHIYRWSAVFVGLFGVLVILSEYVIPGSSEAGERSVVGAGFAIGGAVFGALAATQVRSLVRYEGAATIVVYFLPFHRALLAGDAALRLVGARPRGLRPPGPRRHLWRPRPGFPHPELPLRRRLPDRALRLYLDALVADRLGSGLRHLADRDRPDRRGHRDCLRPLRHMARAPARHRARPLQTRPDAYHHTVELRRATLLRRAVMGPAARARRTSKRLPGNSGDDRPRWA